MLSWSYPTKKNPTKSSNSWMFHVLRIGSDRCYKSPFVCSAKNPTSAYYVQPLPTHRYCDIDPMIPTTHDTQHSSAPRAEVLYLQLMAAVVYMVVGNFAWWIRVFGNSRSCQPIHLFDATVSSNPRLYFILCHLFSCSTHRRIYINSAMLFEFGLFQSIAPL